MFSCCKTKPKAYSSTSSGDRSLSETLPPRKESLTVKNSNLRDKKAKSVYLPGIISTTRLGKAYLDPEDRKNGSSGTIYFGALENTGQKIAIKVRAYVKQEDVDAATTELKALIENQGKYTVKLLDSGLADNDTELLLIQERGDCTLEDFRDALHDIEENTATVSSSNYQQDISSEMILGIRLSLVDDLINGLAEIQKNGWIHKDIKESNLLVSEETVKFADWDIAVKETYTKQKSSTLDFAAPEMGEVYTGKSKKGITNRYDSWATGLVILNLFYMDMEAPKKPDETDDSIKKNKRRKVYIEENNRCIIEGMNDFERQTEAKLHEAENPDSAAEAEVMLKLIKILKGLLETNPDKRTSGKKALKQWNKLKETANFKKFVLSAEDKKSIYHTIYQRSN